MKTLVRSALLILATAFILTVQTPTVSAQTSEGLQIKPAVIEDNVNPGDTYRFTLNVTNLAQTTRSFTLSSQDIEGLDQGGQPIFAENNQPTGYELSAWVTLPITTLTLAAGESKNIPFSIKVPSNATPGSHFGGVFLDTNVRKPDASGAAVGAKVGSIISLRIAGEANEQARLREFSTDKLVYNTIGVNFSTKFENQGNVLLRPHGIIEITNMFGKKVGSVIVNGTAAAVFPASYRTFGTGWSSDDFAFGRYQAIVSMVYGDTVNRTVSGTTSFWILPLKPIAITIGTILLIVILFYAFIRTYIRRKLRAMGVPDARADASLYGKRYGASSSRLMVMVLAIALLCIVFLAILFLMFA